MVSDRVDRTDQTRASYDLLAPRYSEVRRDRSVVQPYLDRFASLLPPGSLVLDVGCGPGFDAAALRERGLRVIGLDRSSGMLHSGLAEWPGPRVQADMRALPIGSGVNGLWVSASLLHLERADVPGALGGFRRLLAPGGWLYLSVKARVKGGSGGSWDEKPYGVDLPRWFTYWSGEELDAALERAGFDVAERRDSRIGGQHWIVRMACAHSG